REIRIRERRRERRASRNEVPQTSTHPRTPLRKHELARQPLLDSQLRRDPPPLIFQLTVTLAHSERLHEDLLLHPRFGHALFNDPVIHLLKQTRHRRHHRRRHLAQVFAHLVKRRRVINRHATVTEHIKPGALENVRQRQHRQRHVSRTNRQTL